MDKQAFLMLVNKVANGTATETELLLYNRYFNHFQELQNESWEEDELGKQSEIEGRLLQSINQSIAFEKSLTKKIPLFKRNWVRAAAVILVMLTSTLIFYPKNKEITKEIAKNHNSSSLPKTLLPGGNKATLTLANGSTVILDDATNGTIASQQNVKIVKLSNGQLAYETLATKSGKLSTVSMNTLATPPGGQYQLTLPDGSIVWLNSGSSLRFPENFIGKERRVELTGEGYFEVAKNALMPFKVKVNEMEVTVLGTHFNIMSYADEDALKTSLLEGSVKVENGKATALLTPGQQSQVTKSGLLKVVRNADLDEAVAWKKGLFYFEDADIHFVMRQIARWYNVEVVYEGEIDQHFTGKINRNVNAAKVLELLELTEKVHFKIEGRKIIVSP